MYDILIIFILILLNGFFAMSEIAVVSARKAQLQADAQKGSKSANRALSLIQEPERFLSTVQIGITLISIVTGIYASDDIAKQADAYLISLGMHHNIAHYISQISIVCIVTFFTILFGELVPKRIGLGSSEVIAKLVAPIMKMIAKVTSPFVWLLSKSTSVIFGLLNIQDKSQKITEDEIKNMVQEGTEEGEVQPVEQDIVERVFLLGDLKIDSIMTRRNEVTWLDINMTGEELKQKIRKNLFDMYPVADKNLDHILGVVYLKDLVLSINDSAFGLKPLIRPGTFFHEGASVYKVLEQMKKQQIGRALVCDEFGVFQGMITLKNIIEGLIGDINESNDDPDIVERSDHSGWLINGQCPFHDFLNYFDLDSLYSDYPYKTLSGLILHRLEHIPKVGKVVLWQDFRLEIIDMDGARIDKVLVTKIQRFEEENLS